MKNFETSNFKRLIGTWRTEGTVLTDNSKIIGTDSYEFILDGNCILHKADVKMGDEKSETFEIISIDNVSDKVKMQHYNSKGESGVMTNFFTGNNYKIEGDKIKFVGTIDNDNTKLTGKWYLQSESGKWTEFIDLKLTKQN